MYVCVYVCMYVCVCVFIYTHIIYTSLLMRENCFPDCCYCCRLRMKQENCNMQLKGGVIFSKAQHFDLPGLTRER